MTTRGPLPMFDDFLRRLKDWWFAPLARALGGGVTPMMVTLAAFVAGVATAWAVVLGANWLALALWILNRTLDGLDGTLARVQGRQSDFGGYVDIVLDFVVYALVPLAMVVAAGDARLAMAGAFLEATFFVNAASWMYLSAILERRDRGAAATGELTTVTMPPGIVAGTETLLLYAAFIVWPGWRAEGFVVMGVLVLVNVLQRLWWGRRHLQ